MRFSTHNSRAQETALVAVSCFVVAGALLLGGCDGPKDFADIYVTPPQPGLSAQTMSGIVIAQNALAQKPDDPKLPYALMFLYLQAVRENADTTFYARVEAM